MHCFRGKSGKGKKEIDPINLNEGKKIRHLVKGSLTKSIKKARKNLFAHKNRNNRDIYLQLYYFYF